MSSLPANPEAREVSPPPPETTFVAPASAWAPAGLLPARAALALLAVTTAAGGALRVWHAGARQFWGDEVHTFEVANQPAGFVEMLRAWWTTPYVADPPLFYVLGWLNVSGAASHDELRLRLPGILMGVLAIPLSYMAARRIAARTVALLTAAFIAFSAFAIQYSQEYRPYSMLLLTAVVFLDALLLACAGFSWRRWCYLFVAALLLIHTHLFGGIALAGGYLVWIACLTRQSSAPRRTRVAAAIALPALLTLLYVPIILQGVNLARYHSPVLSHDEGNTAFFLSLYASNQPYLPGVFGSFAAWRLGAPEPWTLWLTGVLAAAGAVCLLVSAPRRFAAMAFWALFTLAAVWAFYEGLKYHFETRRSIFQLPLFAFFVASGIAAPWSLVAARTRNRAAHAAAAATGIALLAALLAAQAQNWSRYDAGGWRDEPSQADWRGMARWLADHSREGDTIALPSPNGSWVPLHMRFYLEAMKPAGSQVRMHEAVDLSRLSHSGVRIWVVVAQPHELPADTFELLVKKGKWKPFYGGAVVLLPPAPEVPDPVSDRQHFLVPRPMKAVLAPWRTSFAADVVVTGPLEATLRLDPATTTPLLDLKPGAYEAQFGPQKPATDSTSMTLFRLVNPGEWQPAVEFSVLEPSSAAISIPLHNGKPCLSLNHMGSVRYHFLLLRGGEYDLCLEARNDRPGPIALRAWAGAHGETGRFVFSSADNRFSIVRERVRLSEGPQELTVYYDSYRRVENPAIPQQDTVNSFDFARWALVEPGAPLPAE
jgi:4-amino-4-deoxy-L-arabinose transferase-like glycosyltransferase